MNESTIQIRQRGTITLPAELRRKYDIKQGDTYKIIDFDGLFILTPMTPLIPELAREIEQLIAEAGYDVDTLLRGLREERGRYQPGENEA